jgi:hypothetical protein
LVVDQKVRGAGVAQALIDWVARDAEEQGAASLRWHAPHDAVAQDTYAEIKAGHDGGGVAYTRQLDPTAGSLGSERLGHGLGEPGVG